MKVSARPQGSQDLSVFDLSVLSHEVDPWQALVRGTESVDVEKVASCALDPD